MKVDKVVKANNFQAMSHSFRTKGPQVAYICGVSTCYARGDMRVGDMPFRYEGKLAFRCPMCGTMNWLPLVAN